MKDFKQLKEVSLYGSIGLGFSFSVFIGLFFGIWLDRTFSTGPVFTFVFLVGGIAAGYRSILKLINRIKKVDGR